MTFLSRLGGKKVLLRFFYIVASAIVCLGTSSLTIPATTSKNSGPDKALANTIYTIRSATQDHPKIVKILFYGQSISTTKWTDRAVAALRVKFPYVRFVYRNFAIGGWSAVILERAAARDVEEFYPDLIVFHVYGDHRAYERIVRTFRQKTAADIIIQTDHVVKPVEPLCISGMRLRWSPPPGCRGHLWFKQRNWEDYMSGQRLPELSEQYNLALEPRRQRWDAYLRAHHLAPSALLADSFHPNEEGWRLMSSLFTTWFDKVVLTPRLPAPNRKQVRHFAPPTPGYSTTYEFDGNRVELLAAGPLGGKVRITVDGKRSETLDGCWQTSRVSTLPNVPDWPALKQVQVAQSYHQAHQWSIRVTDWNPIQSTFKFTLADAKRSLGHGTSDANFTSSDAKVQIDSQDWIIGAAHTIFNKITPEGSTFTFDRHYVCGDQAPVPLTARSVEQRYVIATGLANTHHVVKVSVNPGAPVVHEVRAYHPSL